jgi:hypothetical protein
MFGFNPAITEVSAEEVKTISIKKADFFCLMSEQRQSMPEAIFQAVLISL